MAEELHIIDEGTKAARYQSLVPQIKSLVDGEQNLIANLSNMMSALKYGMDFFWVGCYFVEGDQLVLGPFQGPIACTRIAKGKGVCGTSWIKKEAIIVSDVDAFPGHIACSSASKSEIVIPVLNNHGDVQLILDVDSDKPADFDEVDLQYLGEVIHLIQHLI